MLRSLTLLVNESPHFFRLRLEFFTILPFLHQAVKAAYTSSLLPHSFCSRFCHEPFVQHCSCFCQLISLFIVFGDEPFKFRRLFFFILYAVCIQMLQLNRDASFYQFMQFFPIVYAQVCISCSWLDSLVFHLFVTHRLFPCCPHGP